MEKVKINRDIYTHGLYSFKTLYNENKIYIYIYIYIYI